MTIKTKYNIGQVVYLRTDIEQDARIITGITMRYSGVIYLLTCETLETPHYDFEFSTTRNQLITLNIESNLQEHE